MKVELGLTREDALASIALEMVIMKMTLEGFVIRRVEVTTGLEAVPVFRGQAPVLVSLRLITELPMASVAPDVLGSSKQVLVKLCLSPESQKASKAHEIMAGYDVVVLKVILEAPWVLEGAQANIAGHIVAGCIVNVVFQAVSIDEDALAEVTVVLVLLWRQLDMHKQRILVKKPDVAHAAPMLVRIIRLHMFSVLDKSRSVARFRAGQGRLVSVANDQRPRAGFQNLATASDFFPWSITVSDLIDEWIELWGQ